jgi:twitching motility two-component system response regulator PilH
MAKVVVVDDSSATVDLISKVVKDQGHTVVSYLNPIDVDSKIAGDAPDLIFMDIVMPEKNGYEVIRALRRNEATKDIPVVIVSSKGEETDVQWGKRQGAVGYITKPFSSQDIITALNAYL